MSDLQSNLRRPRLTGTMAFGLGLTLLVAIVGYLIGPSAFGAASPEETETPVETGTVASTETETAIAGTIDASPTPTPVEAVETIPSTYLSTPAASYGGSVTIFSQFVGCSSTRIIGKVGVTTDTVRAGVTTASNLLNTIAMVDGPVDADGRFDITMTYPAQPDGTRLIIAAGEWDGTEFLQPATMFGADCADVTSSPTLDVSPVAEGPCLAEARFDVTVYSGPAVSYPVLGTLHVGESAPIFEQTMDANVNSWFHIPFENSQGWVPYYGEGFNYVIMRGDCSNVPVVYPEQNSATATPIPTAVSTTHTEAWTLTSTHVSSDPCSGAATVDVTVPVTLTFSDNGTLISLDWYSRVWVFVISGGGVYSGSAVVEDSALENITDEVTLSFSSPGTFDGEMRRVVTIYTTTGNQVCQAFYTWHGTRN